MGLQGRDRTAPWSLQLTTHARPPDGRSPDLERLGEQGRGPRSLHLGGWGWGEAGLPRPLPHRQAGVTRVSQGTWGEGMGAGGVGQTQS